MNNEIQAALNSMNTALSALSDARKTYRTELMKRKHTSADTARLQGMLMVELELQRSVRALQKEAAALPEIEATNESFEIPQPQPLEFVEVTVCLDISPKELEFAKTACEGDSELLMCMLEGYASNVMNDEA